LAGVLVLTVIVDALKESLSATLVEEMSKNLEEGIAQRGFLEMASECQGDIPASSPVGAAPAAAEGDAEELDMPTAASVLLPNSLDDAVIALGSEDA